MHTDCSRTGDEPRDCLVDLRYHSQERDLGIDGICYISQQTEIVFVTQNLLQCISTEGKKKKRKSEILETSRSHPNECDSPWQILLHGLIYNV